MAISEFRLMYKGGISMSRVKYMNKEQKQQYNLSQYPNFSVTGNIYGMKKKYYGMDALLLRSGSWIYHVPADVYAAAK